jgi:hypothetical protein
MRRILAVLGACALLVPTITVGIAAADSGTPPAVAHPMTPNVGPPLGYYEQEAEDCQDNPNYFYHNQAYYHGCMQDRAIVSGHGDTCASLTAIGVVITGLSAYSGQYVWATWAVISAMSLACSL